MPSRAVIVAAGALDALPAEVQTVANELSEAGWQVRLCLGDDATRAGLLRAAGEGSVDLAWLALHSGAAGFGLNDGPMPPAEMGVWLCNIAAPDVVINACYGVQHVADIQRAADGAAVATTIDPAGVVDGLAGQIGVYLVRSYIISRDLAAAVRQASGFGAVQYRFFPAGGRGTEGGRRMPVDRVEEQLALLLRAIRGEPENGYMGLVARVNEIQTELRTIREEQRSGMQEQRARSDEMERELALLKQQMRQPTAVSTRQAVWTVSAITAAAILLLVLILRLGGGI